MREAGLARERTALAWQRTAVALCLVAVLLLARSVAVGEALALATAVPLLAAVEAGRHASTGSGSEHALLLVSLATSFSAGWSGMLVLLA